MTEIEKIGLYCKLFRSEELNLTLREVSEKTDVKLGTLSAFENGRSKNFEHVLRYLSLCDEVQKTVFIRGFNKILEGEK